MDKETQPHWLSAYGVSIAIHVAIIGALIGFSAHQPSIGGDGLISIDLVGNGGGDIGGQGQERKVSLPGDGGTNGDNRRRSPSVTSDSKEQSAEAQKNSASKLSESKVESHEETSQSSQEKVTLLASKKEATQKSTVESTKKAHRANTQSKAKPDKRTPEKREQKAKKSAGGTGGYAGSVGTPSREEGKVISGQGAGTGAGTGQGNYLSNGDGSFTAMSSKGLDYQILYERPAKYPTRARSIGYSKTVKVTVRFLVGVDGKVESSEILTKDLPNLGFQEAALSSIHSIVFRPIKTPDNKPLKVWFKKTLIFKP